MDRKVRATVLAVLGVVLIAGTLGVSAMTAPELGVDDNETRTTLVGSQGGGTGWHDYGSVYSLNGSTVEWREDSAGSYFDVTRLDNGSVMAGFMNTGLQSNCGPYDAPCARTGFRIIDPTASGGPEVVSEYSFPVRSAGNSEVHDVERLDSGEYLLTDMDAERVFTVRNGEVTWEWSASSLYDPPEDPTQRDWLHINDVDTINESHYLVSVRNANQLVVVERGAGVVEVINADDDDSDDGSCQVRGGQLVADEDGDVRCGDPEVLDHQHNPQWLGNGSVLVADSDNDRVVELHRTEDGDWEPAWSLNTAGGLELAWPRDADRLENGHTLVTDTQNQRVFEINTTGHVVWSVSTPRIPYEAERLPDGELVGAVHYRSNQTATVSGEGNLTDPETTPVRPSGDVPLLSTGIVVLRAVVPSTPFWFKELQLGLSLLGIALVVGGGIDRWRAD